MKMMYPFFTSGGKSSGLVKGRIDAILNVFYHEFILPFHLFQFTASSFVHFSLVVDIADKRNLGAIKCNGFYDIDGKAPGIEIEHHIRENPVVIGGDVFPIIGMVFRQLKYLRPVVGVPYLKIAVVVNFGGVTAIIQGLAQAFMYKRNVEAPSR